MLFWSKRAIARATLVLPMLALLAGCAPAPVATQPATPAPAIMPRPTAAPPTAAPTVASLPATAAPTTEALTGVPLVASPTAAPPTAEASASNYLIYQAADGSLQRSDGPGAPPIALSEPAEASAQIPWAAAPDGKTIAIVTGAGLWYQFKQPISLALWLVDASGARPRKVQDLLPPKGVDLTPGGDDAFNLVPALTNQQKLAWSPDGQLVAFVSAHENQVDLYAATLDGTVARLTDTPALEQGPSWSTDGALVAYRTTTGFGTGAGWGDVALAVTPRNGGAPVLTIDDRKLAAGTEAAAIPDLLWLSPNLLVAGLWDSVAGNSEIRAIEVGGPAPEVIFSAPYSGLAWNSATGQLAIAGTPAGLLSATLDERKLAPGLFTWAPGAAQPTQIDVEPVERLAWAPQGDALAYSVTGKQASVRIWSIGVEGDLKPIAGTSSHRLSWSLDGQRLATSDAIYSRAGEKLAGPLEDGIGVGWVPQGFVYAIPTGGEYADLMLWDGAAAQPIASKISQAALAGVVNVKR